VKPRVRLWKQRDEMDCAPIAVLNTLRWLGYPVSCRQDYDLICRLCRCSPRSGTRHSEITKVLRSMPSLSILRPRKVTAERVRQFLRGRDTAVLLSYCVAEGEKKGLGHITTIIRRKGEIEMVNDCCCHLVKPATNADLDERLRHLNGFPSVWFLKREK
jgi:hypothetical protein